MSGDVEAAFEGIEEVPYFGPILGSKRGASDTLHRSSGGVAAVSRDEELVVVTKDEPTLRFDYDVGVGERAFQSDTSNQPEQRIGLHASYGRLTLLARVGIAEVGSTYQSSHSDEALLSQSSGAFRDLPLDTNRTSYAFKASRSISLVSAQ